MRVIYLVRAVQLLFTLNALWMLYSVSSFCERTHHSMAACNDMIARIPMATPEQIEEHLRIKKQRAASNRPPVKTNTSSPQPLAHSTPTTAEAAPIAESSTVPTSFEEVKKRVKREERRELPGNGMTEAQRKAAAAVVPTKKEEEKMEGKKEEEKKKEREKEVKKDEEKKKEGEKEVKKEEEKKKEGEKEVKKEEENKEEGEKEVKKEEKREEVKMEETTPEPSHAKTDYKKEQHREQKEEQKLANRVLMTEIKTDEVKIEEKNEKTVETKPAPIEKSPKEKKEQAGAKVEIPVAATTQKDQKDDVIKADHAPSITSGDDKHHTVKKDLKVHVQEPVKVEETKKESNATPPTLAPNQKRFVLEHADAFLQEVRCLEVTSDAYFGKDVSPFAEHLKGLVFVGPILVVIAVYIVCTVMRTRLSTDHPSEFTQMLGCVFHSGMWMVVGLSMFFIYNHWTDNWHTVSSNTFAPDFPCQWSNLIILAFLMMVATSVESWFHKRLHYDIVIERSYRCYEVIDNSEEVAAGQNRASHFSRTNVY